MQFKALAYLKIKSSLITFSLLLYNWKVVSSELLILKPEIDIFQSIGDITRLAKTSFKIDVRFIVS